MSKRYASPKDTERGMDPVTLPGLHPVVWAAKDREGIPVGMHRMWNDRAWLLLYFFTPARVRINVPAPAWYPCPANVAVLVPAFCHYTVDTRMCQKGESPVRHCWLRLQSVDPSPLFGMAQNTTGMVRFVDLRGILGRHMLGIVDVAEQLKDDAFWAMQTALRPVVRCLTGSQQVATGVYEIRDDALHQGGGATVPKVLTYLQRNLARRIHIREMAAQLKLSPSTVSHAYRKFTGESPMQTQRRLRIQRIKTLLFQNTSLAAAADEVGFYDARHASREFKRSEGMTPKAFLRVAGTTSYRQAPQVFEKPP